MHERQDEALQGWCALCEGRIDKIQTRTEPTGSPRGYCPRCAAEIDLIIHQAERNLPTTLAGPLETVVAMAGRPG